MTNLAENLARLDQDLARLEKSRDSDPFVNDVYEAAWYWRDLGRWVLEGDTKVNYAARASEELAPLSRLESMLVKRTSEEASLYPSLFPTARQVLSEVAMTVPPQDGHLGILRIIRNNCDFLVSAFHFEI